MTTQLEQAAKLALEALQGGYGNTRNWHEAIETAIAALRAALEQPAQDEPVAWMDGYRNIYSLEEKAAGCEDAVIPLYPHPMQHWSDCAVHNAPAYPSGKCDCGGYTRPANSLNSTESSKMLDAQAREPLTNEQIDHIYTGIRAVHHDIDCYTLARAIEAAHGIGEKK